MFIPYSRKYLTSLHFPKDLFQITKFFAVDLYKKVLQFRFFLYLVCMKKTMGKYTQFFRLYLGKSKCHSVLRI